MIYIFQGCGAACKAPCICCKAVGQAFDGVCKGCGEACTGCAKALSDCWAPIVQNPLGPYVIGTWGFMVLAIACAVATIPDANKNKCNDLMTFCIIDCVVCVIHAAFAFYIQRALVSRLREKGDMSHAQITQEAKSLAKYDIAFCLYFFFFMASFGYNIYGIGENGKCIDTGYQKGAIGLVIVYQICAWNYAVCWYCGQCCFSTAHSMKAAHAGVGAPVTVGQPGTPAKEAA
eukprot:CAMPEP_0204520008 /NCGR_PEP_ID=MMETSP0661-20131031/5034_1 /ASSEMBLY_ACC=CAM_ASM_000606 /TAXON_ID=109239 /ORGANISM="Alexandrium margalefi, Strain AMGDE01CS-322" /LENGTH=231 /DNA_ID=CAMNT_0051525543 /DNA_START=46 /DNA_END=741 /DNA_ORIENTATION=+